LKRQGRAVAALAVIMVDNPMCPVTGHRICNDCMKACIYQKLDPVNIPQIETRALTDVLALPWGVEIYDLLTRWNPLRARQWLPKPYNGLKVLIAGMGPAGFTLAHHLLMEGFAVVGTEGLKIEPLPRAVSTGDAGAFELTVDQTPDAVCMSVYLIAEAGIYAARLGLGKIGQQGQGCLQGVRQITQRLARAAQTSMQCAKQSIELAHQWQHFARYALGKCADLAVFETREIATECGQRLHSAANNECLNDEQQKQCR
jgi:hypothetical protein